MGCIKDIIEGVDRQLKSEKRSVLSFEQFLSKVQERPLQMLRCVFQLFHDFVMANVEEEKDDYPDDPESIGFKKWNCDKLLVAGMDNPFFSDSLFANRFIRTSKEIRTGTTQQNKIYIFRGPHGCGKSTFENNLLDGFGRYTDSPEGEIFEIVWRLETDNSGEILEIPCPSHDNPILVFPRQTREYLLREALGEDGLKKKEYEWLLKGSCCPICRSMFYALLEKFDGNFEKVQEKIFARSYKFDRILGEGVSVFSPGDRPSRQVFLVDDNLQEKINKYFGSSNAVRYMFSRFAKTNNGIYVLMDVKGHNKGRFEDLHGIVSEGMHKLDECIEEGVQSLFFVVTNPEDIQIGGKINKESKSLVVDESFSDRIGYIDASYLTGVEAEVRIWKNLFGNNISDTFLPGVLDNFARVIISSRLVTDSPALEAWLGKDFATKYSKYCDANGLLLKMEIYSGNLPKWLSEEDVKSFVKKHRKDLILKEGEKEGLTGISGRDSIRLFNSFYFSRKQKQFVTMAHVDRFFRDLFKNDPLYKDHVPKGFLDSLKNWYDYTVVQQLKESLYDYNEAQIKEDIIHYIFSLSHDVGEKVHCPYTGKEINITEDFLSITEDRIFGEALADEDREYFREDRMEEFTRVLAQEGLSLKIEETRMFEDLYESFVHRIKETVLIPFIKNNNFREAIKSYAEEDFKTFDSRIREKVTLLIKNLCGKFGYTEESAKEICVYVLDNKIADKFA